jgi:hypothetical protein
MSRRKQSGVVHGRDGERDVSPVGSRSDNQIIAVVRRGLRGHRPTVILDLDGEKPPPGSLVKMILSVFSAETLSAIGALVYESLLTGDKRMIKTLRDAIKQADHLFNRDREPVLLRQALGYMITERGKDWETLDELKKGIEDRFNCGNKLPQHKWNRIRKALRLPKDVTGRPRKSDSRRRNLCLS